MIDADEKTVLKSLQSRALDAVSFEDKGGVVFPCDGIRMNDLICEWEALVDSRNRVFHDDLCFFAHEAQDLPAGEGRTDRIAIRAGV